MMNLIGETFGRLTVISEGPRRMLGGMMRRVLVCRCACGNLLPHVNMESLRQGLTGSCGCLHSDELRERVTTHGMSHARIMGSYKNMKCRCLNPKTPYYKYYGGRGISVCPKWMTFAGFYDDMGASYIDGYTIERVDVNGNYCKENCAWVKEYLQHRNTRLTVRVPLNGQMVSLVEYCEKEGLRYSAVQSRMKRGVPFEKAINLMKIRGKGDIYVK